MWDGKLRNGTEHKILKTCAAQLAALQGEIKSTHPYAVAEI